MRHTSDGPELNKWQILAVTFVFMNWCFNVYFPVAEILNGEPMFVFNLSSVSSSEVVFSGEIHVYRKRPKSADHAHDAYVFLHQVAPQNYLKYMASLRMTSPRFGWQSYDITSSVQGCLGSTPQQRLAVSFASGNIQTEKNTLPLKHFIRHNIAMPFLIVFSNDTQNITLDHIDPHFSLQGGSRKDDVIIDPEFGREVPLFGEGRRASRGHRHSRERTFVSYGESTLEETTHYDAQESEDEVELSAKSVRSRRSIFDNEIPEHPLDAVEPDAPYNVPRTHPGILQGRNQLRHQIPVTSSEKLLPYPEDYEDTSSKRRRRKDRRGRKKKDRKRKKNKSKEHGTIPFPPEWEREITHQQNTVKVSVGSRQEYLCGKRRLSVDFADIGWSDWIISPKSFEAHYCAGTCPFPLTKVSKTFIRLHFWTCLMLCSTHLRWMEHRNTNLTENSCPLSTSLSERKDMFGKIFGFEIHMFYSQSSRKRFCSSL